MKVLVVISLEVNEPEDVVGVLEHIDPPTIPHFAQEIRIVVGPDVDDVIKFLEEE